ncbi:MAG TPA: acetyl-CoA hydrolase [Henriciella marina]|uniref:acetyl-CoA hydrolase/transferase family protein n=1 Tax=Henriciella sp. TaxID=1968823 RepID=UPI00179A5359|nr:acetyl-CoA hydrolase/transferase C-terminal domain-containing protein [Henriciella sp.]HIG23259.1 acetyl-CoA hydrolase [Henriciella sp.]HIK64243.1 acetyl-CoA hydrolase [Henriciella marina]
MRSPRDVDLKDVNWPALISPGDLVVWGQASAEPDSLTRSLMAARHKVGRFRAFAGIGYGDCVSLEHADMVEFTSYCGTGKNRSLGDQLSILPVHYTELARTLISCADGQLIVLIRLAPGNDEEYFSFGAGGDYLADLLPHARLVIAEVSSETPRTGDGRDVHRSDLDIIIRTASPCPQPASQSVGETERTIASHVAGLIDDGATLQIGLGSLPAAILSALQDHRRLGVHSGLITDGVMELSQAGVITNESKAIDAGCTVAGVLSGGKELMGWADGNRHLLIKPSSYTHAESVIGQIKQFTAINSAIEVDLSGQVNAEVAGGRYVGAVGGAVNFMRGAAASKGGKGIIALPSTAKGRSRIVAELSGPVTTPRADVGFVVTEFGVADLRHATLDERRERLMAIAHPDFRRESEA